MNNQNTSIQLIASDIDGTLLNSDHEISERTEKAIRAAMAQGVHFVLATGKTRSSAVHLIQKLGLRTPGIFLQGLAIYDSDGNVLNQSAIDPVIARHVITYAEDRGFTMLAYCGDRILMRAPHPIMEQMAKYHEPQPEYVGPLQNWLDKLPINKIAAIGEDRRITALRWQLGMQLNGSAKLVQAAIPHMLEILPPGASKGAALRSLLKSMKISMEHVLAIGDGENDIEMLQSAGIGVAVGNADAKVKEAANYVVASNDEDGLAEAIERFVLPPPAEPEPSPMPAVESAPQAEQTVNSENPS
jgi:Cof subfamily protein (haloacid dehalogenase superfamily)